MRCAVALVGLVAVSIVSATAGPDSPAPPAVSTGTQACRPGPWGKLRFTRIVIEPPDQFLAADYSTPDEIRWIFVGYTQPQLTTLWQTAGVRGSDQTLLDRCTRSENGNLVVRPPSAFILAMQRDTRARIYAALALFLENPDQNEPFRFRRDLAAEWFAQSGLAPRTIALIEPLLYPRGHSMLFSDQDVLLPQIASKAERVRLVRTLARKSTLLVSLLVSPDSDLEGLARYWGRGPRSKDIGSLLRSLSQHGPDQTIDVAHLLPRFARARLYTYAEPVDHPNDVNYDCHWTCLNFFNDPPDSRYADAAVVKQTLENEYEQISTPPMLGDILVFFREDGKAIHSCVYVADDIVFTKNGSSQVMPWILMQLPDVIAFYPADPPLKIGVYRHKGW